MRSTHTAFFFCVIMLLLSANVRAETYAGTPEQVLPKAAVLQLAAKDALELPELGWLRGKRDAPDFLEQLNRVVNISRYVEELPGQDVWQRPRSLFRYGGDCEDFAIAKYGVLRALGMSAAHLRVLVVAQRDTGEYHAILAVTAANGDWIGLDNRRSEPWRSSDFLKVYRPLYAVNEDGVWLSQEPALNLAAQQLGGTAALTVKPSR
ncbi:MAG: transglutaminase-like cysteine peptidase [Alphaproteobacteria bacterium]|jgi:predicted transglutaminase-like cysteine proteinase|nr:transglutaminase-like cysteine peptidase [Alphaproteobacteria bacterium]